MAREKLEHIPGRVLLVTEDLAGSTLADVHLSGAMEIFVDDATYFLAEGGTLQIGDEDVNEQVEYESVDLDNDVLELASPLVNGYDRESPVLLWPLLLIRNCEIEVVGADDTLQAVAPSQVWDVLPVGTRNDDEREQVLLVHNPETNTYVVHDVYTNAASVDPEDGDGGGGETTGCCEVGVDVSDDGINIGLAGLLDFGIGLSVTDNGDGSMVVDADSSTGISVTDLTETVDPTTDIEFDPYEFEVTDAGDGVAQVSLLAGVVVTDLPDLADVSDTADVDAADGDVLTWDDGGGEWVPAPLPASGGTGMAIYGDGSDGSFTYDSAAANQAWATRTGSVWTLTRDVFHTSATINDGVTVNTENFRVFCTGTLTVGGGSSGIIGRPGKAASLNAGGAGTNSGTMGAAGTGQSAAGSGTTVSAPGASGAWGNTYYGHLGGGAGNGGNSNGGTAPTRTADQIYYPRGRTLIEALSGIIESGSTSSYSSNPTYAPRFFGGGSGGGAGGRSAGTTATTPGGGGGGGGCLLICARILVIAAGATVTVKGADGANATGAGDCVTGGGGAGGGGIIWFIYDSLTNSGTVTVAGGTKGTGLNGASAAGDGSAGTLIQIANA